MADLLFEGVVAYGNGDIEPMEKPTVNFLAGGCKFDDHQAVRVLNSVFFTARGRALNVIAPDRFDAGKYEFRENTYYKLSGPPLAWNERSFDDLPSWQQATGLDATSRVVEGRPDEAWVFLRPNRYEADKAFLIVYNWPRTARVSVDLANLWRLTPGTPFRVVSVEDIWGRAAAEGRFEGEPVEVPMTGVYAPEFAGWDHEAWYYATCYSRSHNSPPKGSADRIMHGWAKQKNPQALNAAIKDMVFGMRLTGHGDHVAIVAEIQDRKVVQQATAWRGSCVEIFGSMPGSMEIGQVFLVPKAGDSPAAAYRAEGARQVATSDVQISSAERENGYELRALIPLWLLKLDPQKDQWLLEFQVSSERRGQRTYHTLFGSRRAYENNVRYGLFEVRRPSW